uniref:Radical SAM protein n=1 Tax=Ignisphaera aggregans TaxID=334771 RepID=A0A7C2ZP45_9CREN
MPRLLGTSRGKYFIYVDDLPLVGHIAFGVIDRCTNVLQIRPTTVCPYNCIYCSVDAGPFSRHRLSEFIVEGKLLVKWVKRVYEAKMGEVVEGLIDGVGEPATHPEIVYIVNELKKFLPRVAMESRGLTLSKNLIDKLSEAGLDRINLSIDTLNPNKIKYIQGAVWFDVKHVMDIVEYIVKNTSIDVHLTPVWLPGLNDKDIEEIIDWGLKIGVGKKFPPFGIQKYEVHKYGRHAPKVRQVGWDAFRDFVDRLEQKYGIPLYHKNIDFGIRKTRCYPRKFKRGDVISATIVSPGWLKNEVIAVDKDFDIAITIVDSAWSSSMAGTKVKVRLIEVYDTIYLAKRAD